jgi:hypothetical protein
MRTSTGLIYDKCRHSIAGIMVIYVRVHLFLVLTFFMKKKKKEINRRKSV